MHGRIVALVALAAFSGAAIAAICGESEELRRQRTVDVESLTFEQVQDRALAAVRQPGSVYHLVAVTHSSNGDYREEVWLDVDERLGRRHTDDGETVDLQYGDRRAFVMEERFYDGPCDPCPEHEAAMLAPQLRWLLLDGANDHSLHADVIDGEPVIRVTVEREFRGESPYDATARLYLTEDFLPIRIDVNASGPRPDTRTELDSDFIDRGGLPKDWFRPEALQSLAGGPIGDLRAAGGAGLDVYWLGEAYESMILRDESRFYPQGLSLDGDASLMLSYGPADPMNPSPCVMFRIQRLGERAPISVPDGVAAFGEIEVDGETAFLYRAIRPPLTLPAPDPGDTQSDEPATPYPGVVPAVTVAPLTPVAGDTGEVFAAVIETDDTVVEVATNCGPVGSNVYRTEQAFLRLVQSLVRYDPASP